MDALWMSVTDPMAGLKRWLRHSLVALSIAYGTEAWTAPVPQQQPIGRLERVADIRGAMPTGVAVSASGRIFINFPRWGDHVPFTVAELIHGLPVAFPSATLNAPGDVSNQHNRIVSAQSVVIGPSGMHLWIVDTGTIRPQPITYGGPKLIEVDLRTNQVSRTILIEPAALEPKTYLNDVRLLLNHSQGGYAFISDSSAKGGIIVVDLSSGKSWRRLGDTPFTRSDPDFVPMVEAKVMMVRERGKQPVRFAIGSDGMAVTADGERLFFRPLTSRHLYSIPTNALIDRTIQEQKLQTMVVDHGEVGGASDGLEADASGGIYLTDYEHNAIHRFTGTVASLETIMHSAEAIWPDSLSLADDGYLYFTANQLNRQAIFNHGVDKRMQPYAIFRIKTPHKPIRKTPANDQAAASQP